MQDQKQHFEKYIYAEVSHLKILSKKMKLFLFTSYAKSWYNFIKCL